MDDARFAFQELCLQLYQGVQSEIIGIYDQKEIQRRINRHIAGTLLEWFANKISHYVKQFEEPTRSEFLIQLAALLKDPTNINAMTAPAGPAEERAWDSFVEHSQAFRKLVINRNKNLEAEAETPRLT